MKMKLLIFTIIYLSLISCNDVKDKKDVINSDKIWYSEKMMDTPAQYPDSSFKKLLDTVAYFMEKEKLNSLRVEYDFMVNKNGGVDQILIRESNSEIIDSVIIASVKDWQFKAGIKLGTNVNSIFPLKMSLKVGETLKVIDENEFLVSVDQMPELIGGLGSILSKIKYPEIAKRAGVEGKVFVVAFIDEKGNVANAKISKGIGSGCDEAALDAVKQTKFTPGKQKGKPVKVQVTIPIVFKLQ